MINCVILKQMIADDAQGTAGSPDDLFQQAFMAFTQDAQVQVLTRLAYLAQYVDYSPPLPDLC